MKNTTARGAAPRGIYPHQVYGPLLANAEIAVAPRKTEVAFNGFRPPVRGRKSCVAESRGNGGFLNGPGQPTSFCVIRLSE